LSSSSIELEITNLGSAGTEKVDISELADDEEIEVCIGKKKQKDKGKALNCQWYDKT